MAIVLCSFSSVANLTSAILPPTLPSCCFNVRLAQAASLVRVAAGERALEHQRGGGGHKPRARAGRCRREAAGSPHTPAKAPLPPTHPVHKGSTFQSPLSLNTWKYWTPLDYHCQNSYITLLQVSLLLLKSLRINILMVVTSNTIKKII